MTYSIVARDEKTGEMGVAVQSHFFSVGSVVTWARAGVGAVATQAMVDVKYGPLGLELMAGGKSADEALKALLRADPSSDSRQVAMVDSKGRVSAHTGAKCLPHAGHITGHGFSCQGNIMRNDRVWGAMKKSFEKNRAIPLAERMVSALEAAEEAGGDIRGKQSSAILVVSSEPKPNHWEGRSVDLRVEDHPAPVPELRRLLRYQRGYEWANRGDDFLTVKDYPKALEAYAKAYALVPEVDELKFWSGIGLLASGRTEKGEDVLQEVIAKDRNWAQVMKGVAKVGSPPISPDVLQRILGGKT
jgi:uncharacterized Ntn-hydrolase superfamily protein